MRKGEQARIEKYLIAVGVPDTREYGPAREDTLDLPPVGAQAGLELVKGHSIVQNIRPLLAQAGYPVKLMGCDT